MRRAQAASPRRSASARRHSTISVHTDHPAAKAVPSRSTRATTGRRTMAKRPARAPGQKKKESADKPGFVVGSHSSGSCVAAGFKQPTRERRGPRHSSPIWSCSRWGLPCHAALTPHAVRSYRTVSPLPRVAAATRKPDAQTPFGGLLSVALSVDSRRPGVTWHLALRSPDFPRRAETRRDCLADSSAQSSRFVLGSPRPSASTRQAPARGLQWTRSARRRSG